MIMKLLLFDIDGTLIRSSGAGRLAMTVALESMFGTAGPIESYRFSGKTDARIFTDLLTAVDIPPRKIEDSLPELYERMGEAGRQIFPEKEIRPCIGVPRLLEQLRERDDVYLGLLTGNVHQTAPLKLAAGGIDPTQFHIGAYGSEAMERNQLTPLAMARASEQASVSFTGNNTIVIGDTPADILCARAGQATAVAVATGWHAADTLSRYNPDHLFLDLSDTSAILSALLAEPKS